MLTIGVTWVFAQRTDYVLRWYHTTSKEHTMKNVDQRVQEIQTEGNESAMFALLDRPEMQAAIESAIDNGARWSRYGHMYGLSEPGCMETLVLVDPADDTADFGSGIQKYL
jgi:hypothetical protein